MSVSLDELKRRLKQETGELPWVHPKCVVGYDRAMALGTGERAWFDIEDEETLKESAVEVVPEYLNWSLTWNRTGDATCVTGRELLDAVIWLALHIGSRYAVSRLAVWGRRLLVGIPLEESLRRVLSAVEKANEPFIRDILRYLLWDFFGISGDFAHWKEIASSISPECLREVEELMAYGYETTSGLAGLGRKARTTE